MGSKRTRVYLVPPPEGSYFACEWLAFGYDGHLVAKAPNEDDAKNRAIAKGCFTPLVIPGCYLSKDRKETKRESGELEKKLE